MSNCSGPQAGRGLTNTGPFANVHFYYWSATEYAADTGYAWNFNFNVGYQDNGNMTNSNYAWAVRDGDVYAASAVPVPAAAWLFGSGLIGLIGVARK